MPKVLLVDDEPNIRWTMAELLKREGYEALTAADFESAVSTFETNAIDAALIDIVLPSRSGIEILKSLQGREPYVPVIMVTGEPNISQMPEIVRAGAYDFLSKPVVKDALIAAVSRAVAHKRLLDEKRELEHQIKLHAEQLEVTVAKRTHELAEARDFLDTILNSSTEHAIVALNTVGSIMLFNRGAEVMFGRSASSAMGIEPLDLLRSRDGQCQSPFLVWGALALKEGSHREEVELRRANDQTFVGSMTVSPIRQRDGILLGYLCIVKDLTEERRNEERLRQMSARLARHEKIAALGRMAAQLAHEIKNPLAGLRLYSLHLKSKIAGKIPAAEESLVDKINDGIDRLSETAEQVLNFARPVTVTPRPADLNEIVRASLALIEPQLNAKRIRVELNLGQQAAWGAIDEAAMRSTLLNLMLNSIQAMNEGGRLAVSTRARDNELRLEISDTGSGMTEEEAKHIFEPFFTTKSQGLGLGLYFAATIIEQHNGSVEVKSEPGKGSEFTIRLPMERGKADGVSG